MGRFSRFLTLAGASWLLASPAASFETDQYLAWGVQLEDSAPRINDYINGQIRVALVELNERRPGIACRAIPRRLSRHLFFDLFSARLKYFVQSDPGIDRWPKGDTGYVEHLRRSLYRKPTFPFYLPLSPTVRIGEVYMGADKLSHMFGFFGREYYRIYQRGRRRGLSEEKAMGKAIRWGIFFEANLVGGLVDGIVSFADLEANFQGLMMWRDLCEKGHLERAGEGWTLVRPIDLRDYVNPAFDETYNASYYFPNYRWKRVRPVLESDYCERREAPEVVERMRLYRRLDRPSFSRRMVEEHFRRVREWDLDAQRLEALCPGTPAPSGQVAVSGE